MPSQKNQEKLDELKQKLENIKNVILADYQGISVSDQVELRAKIAEAGGEFLVTKNTIIRLALKDRLGSDLPENLDQALNGPTAILFGYEDAVSATKALVDFTKDHEAVEVKAGLLAGTEGQTDKVLGVEEIKNLANLPSREELLGQLVARLNGPTYGLVNVLQGNLRKVVYALNAIKDQKAAA